MDSCLFSFILLLYIPQGDQHLPNVVSNPDQQPASLTCEPHCPLGSPAQIFPALPGGHSSVPQHWTRGPHREVWGAQKLLHGDPVQEAKQEIKLKVNPCTYSHLISGITWFKKTHNKLIFFPKITLIPSSPRMRHFIYPAEYF